jgi:hypothetical protein
VLSYFIASLTQAETNPPIVTELLNTTGATITTQYIDVGLYTITFSEDVFDQPCAVLIGKSSTNDDSMNYYIANPTTLYLYVFDRDSGTDGD